MKHLLVFILIFVASLNLKAQEIEEAQGLADEAPVSSSVETARSENFRYRAYFFIEGLSQKTSMTTNTQIPNWEANLTTDYKTGGNLTLFFDGVARFYDYTDKTQGFLNQAGLRYQATENLNFAIGKERNRRSPGIIISPSDLLIVQTNLPGLREDRRGAWLGRTSYQLAKSSYDLFILPVSSVDDGGLPTANSKYQGTLLRTLQQFENLDVSFTIGQLTEMTQAGLAIQAIASNVWKIYYEGGYKEKHINILNQENRNVMEHLVGLSFEGSEDFGLKAEYFYNDQGLSSKEYDVYQISATPNANNYAGSLFMRKQYGIVTFSSLEIKNHFNFFTSLIKSLEDSSSLGLIRLEYLVSDHLVAGSSGIFVNVSEMQQVSLDLKYTF